MKKYYSKYCKYGFAALVVGLIMLSIGAVFCLAFRGSFLRIKLFLIIFGINITGLSAMIYFAEKSRWLAIYDNELHLPRGVQVIRSGVKAGLRTKRTSLKIDEIVNVTRYLYKGDQNTSADTYFYFFNTENGESYYLPLYAYGEESIKEIMNKLSALGVNTEGAR